MHPRIPALPRRDHDAALLRWRRQRERLQSNLQDTVCRALEDVSDRELDRQLDQLCCDLVDYLAIGHGSVYARYCPLPDSRHASRSAPGTAVTASERGRLLQEIWLHLGRTTDAALRFNRRCETTPLAALQQKLHAELGKLNKTLSLRFALEEQLLELGAAARPPAQE